MCGYAACDFVIERLKSSFSITKPYNRPITQ
jgi:hypothetical protein